MVFTAIMMIAMPAFIKAVGMPEVLGGAWIGGTIGCTFFIYSRMIRWASAKFDLESKLDPIFQPKKARPRKEREE